MSNTTQDTDFSESTKYDDWQDDKDGTSSVIGWVFVGFF